MRALWYGQSAVALEAGGQVVAIDPFGAMGEQARAAGMRFEYPAIEGLSADLLLVTHEHFDHNGVEVVGGEPQVVRASAGRFETPVGEVVGIASEHDPEAGTRRGGNTIFVFTLGGVRVCHLGDFGQSGLREEQERAIGPIDLLFLPVGGGPTLDAAGAAEVVRRLGPRWAVPMHYRTGRTDFLEPADAFLAGFDPVHRCDGPSFDTDALPDAQVVVPAAP